MDLPKLRAWWAQKQGLDGSLRGLPPESVLERTGWSRSVGGANPYLALHARSGTGREVVDQAVASLRIHELPSARGCTYVLPAGDYATGLLVGQGFSEETTVSAAVRHLGVTREEVEGLQTSVLVTLKDGPLDPTGLKSRLGDEVRNLGHEGKKRGITTTLPLALGKLQSAGRIRRMPLNGRIDGQRYAYALWLDGPALEPSQRTEAVRHLADEYFRWIGPATLKDFQWFSGLGVSAVRDATSGLDLVDVGDGQLLPRSERDAFNAFEAPKSPTCTFVGSIDNLSHLRAGLSDLIDESDHGVLIVGERATETLSMVTDLASHAIYDRGRLVGVWDYDPEACEVVWHAWAGDRDLIASRAADTEEFVQTDLTDARTFSLDSPASRKPRIAALRALGRG